MFARLLAACSKLDERLHARLGRPYGIVLTLGLMIEIAHRLLETPKRAVDAGRLAPLVLVILLNAALLLHQLGELGERFAAKSKPAGEV